MSKQLFSSDEAIAAFSRGGFEPARKSKGGHLVLKRRRSDGRHDMIVVPMGRKEIPKGTLRGMLRQGNVTHSQFLIWARTKEKGRG